MKRYPLLLFLMIFVVGMIFFQRHSIYILECIQKAGMAAPVLFIVLYVCATVFFLPTLMLSFAGGLLFGPWAGTIINLIGACLGAIVAFCITRHWLLKQLPISKNQSFNRIIHGIEQYDWYFLALIRALPLIPFNLVNYGMGFTTMSLRKYCLVSVIFLAPTEIFYTWCGFKGGKMLTTTDVWSNRISVIIALGFVVVMLLYKGGSRLYRSHKTPQ